MNEFYGAVPLNKFCEIVSRGQWALLWVFSHSM